MTGGDAAAGIASAAEVQREGPCHPRGQDAEVPGRPHPIRVPDGRAGEPAPVDAWALVAGGAAWNVAARAGVLVHADRAALARLEVIRRAVRLLVVGVLSGHRRLDVGVLMAEAVERIVAGLAAARAAADVAGVARGVGAEVLVARHVTVLLNDGIPRNDG